MVSRSARCRDSRERYGLGAFLCTNARFWWQALQPTTVSYQCAVFVISLDYLLIITDVDYTSPAPVLYNLSYATSLIQLYIDGLQSSTGNLRDTILGLPALPFMQHLKIIYGTDIALDDGSLEHWGNIMCFLKNDRFPCLKSMLITVYWSHHCAKLHAKDFWDCVPKTFPAYNKDIKVTVSVICDHPFRSLRSLTRAYHMGNNLVCTVIPY